MEALFPAVSDILGIGGGGKGISFALKHQSEVLVYERKLAKNF
jgi:shikimate 5-dehydrogenase